MVARFIGKLNQTFQRKTTDLSYVIDKCYQIEHTWSRTRIELTILSLSRTDCICYCKINYHMLVVAKLHKYCNNHTEQRTTERQENVHVNWGEWDKTLQVTRSPLKTEGELMCSGRVFSSCSTSDTYVILIH
jgi:hypothetical protein